MRPNNSVLFMFILYLQSFHKGMRIYPINYFAHSTAMGLIPHRIIDLSKAEKRPTHKGPDAFQNLFAR